MDDSARLKSGISARRRAVLVIALLLVCAAVVCPRPLHAQAGDAPPSPVTATETPAAEPSGPQEPAKASVLLRGDPLEMIGEMGPLGWIFSVLFLLSSVIALWFAIERVVILRRSRVIPRPFVERFLQHLEQRKLNREEALDLCQQSRSPVAAVFAHGIRKWGKPSVEVEQAIIDGGERQVALLRKHLRVLNGVATVTPLIGLLGTVCGMILAFDEIATSDAMGRAEQLGSDIGLALMTTAAGLSIAIPSLILYMYLAGRVDALVMEMDDLAQNVVHLISAEGLAEKNIPAPRVRSAKSVRPEKEAG